MKFRLTSLLVALPALVAGLLVASSNPSAAANYETFVTTKHVSIDSKGFGKVYVACHSSSHTCKGSIYFKDDPHPYRKQSYSIGAGKSGYVRVAMHTYADASINPNAKGPGYQRVDNVKLAVDDSYPDSTLHYYTVDTETPVKHRDIKGQINGNSPGGAMTNLTVQLQRIERGGNVTLLHTAKVTDGGNYSFNANLGTNNSPSNPYVLQITGIDKDGEARSWYWRGTSGNTSGGSRYIRKASTVQAVASGDFIADFNYGAISGTISGANKERVIVAAVPPPGSNAAIDRDLDLVSCADIHAETTTTSSGHYEVDFLPFKSGDNRYMVGAFDGSRQTWNGNIHGGFGSCLDTIGYDKPTKDNLIDLGTDGLATASFPVQAGNTVKIDGHFSKKFSPTGQGDRWVTVREKIPGLHVLEDPVVKYAVVDSEGNATLTNIPKGQYYVEMGRRTGCADWQKSHFPNNDAYFKGLDRGSEVWKSFTKLSALSNAKEDIARNVRPNHATSADQGHVPSGYKGWMYRDFCKAYGAGTINSMTVPSFADDNFKKKITSDSQGAVVKGHVSRTGGRTNKEMMVRLSSSKQTLVVRADVTDGSGNFYIAGIASGTYTVSVNSDSWRGIGRTFTGRHTITVHAGRGYNLGKLTFHG